MLVSAAERSRKYPRQQALAECALAGPARRDTGLQEADPIRVLERGARVEQGGQILISNLPGCIATDERQVVEKKLGWHRGQVLCHEVESDGPGNLVTLCVRHEQVCELSHGFGMRGTSARRVATEAVRQLQRYLDSSAPVGVHLADQLMLPLALLAGGRFRSLDPSRHCSTNAFVINTFLGREHVRMERLAAEDWLIEVQGVL